MKKCWQFIVKNNQETCYPHYMITQKHYSSLDECEKDWGAKVTECCFSVVGRFKPSYQYGYLAEVLTKHERQKTIDSILEGL